VRDRLVTAGADAGRVASAGRGEREPLVPTDDGVAEPRNHRVEITLR
jgi:outer membrane protein OmpA-like peptidoglycan-associated protein